MQRQEGIRDVVCEERPQKSGLMPLKPPLAGKETVHSRLKLWDLKPKLCPQKPVASDPSVMPR